MSSNTFLHKENLSTLWDVISDEEIFKELPTNIQIDISDIFLNNLKAFYNFEKQQTLLLFDMNKKYMIIILNYIKYQYKEYQASKIKIFDEPPNQLITFEEIQNDRQTAFDKNLLRRQEEFKNAMTLNVPEPPTFSDNIKEEPIQEIDHLLKEIISSRNYDIDTIASRNNELVMNANINVNTNTNTSMNVNTNTNTNTSMTNDWLKSQDTSIKNEKFQFQSNTFKEKKNVSWDDSNIFSKLKKIQNVELKLQTDDDTNNIPSISVDSNVLERIHHIEENIVSLNSKFDTILEILQREK